MASTNTDWRTLFTKMPSRPTRKPTNEALSAAAARTAGLRYVTSKRAGITRIPFRRSFRYLDANGRKIVDDGILDRIRKLAIPPAWQNVWISSREDSHLQATGIDARGRKQYRYHQDYRAIRDSVKFDKLRTFGKVLPRINAVVAADLRRRGLEKRKLAAAVVRLLKATSIRVGNDEYAKANKSFGLTTMHNRHVQILGEHIRFRFRGKSKINHDITLTDRRLALIIKKCRCIPGCELFQYVDHDGNVHSLDSGDINEYLMNASGETITAKDFRTWNGSCLAITRLLSLDEEEGTVKQRIVKAVQEVATELGNRPATCRKFYIHPLVLSAYETGKLATLQSKLAGRSGKHTLEEKLLLHLLKEQVA